MSAAIEQTRRIWTEAEIQALPDDGHSHEIVDGELVMSPKNNFQHEQICERLNFALEGFNRERRLGAVFGSSMGFWMANQNCRTPDISFVAKQRLIRLAFRPTTKTFFPGAPDLAIEVLSPHSRRGNIEERLKDFFANGTQIAWVIYPDEESVEVWHSLANRRRVGSDGWLEGEDLLPGFRYPVRDLFKGWDWE